MRAAVLTGAGKYKIRQVPLPEPGDGQVRIKLEGCGVCASNLTPWAGPEWMRFPTAPGELGHEAPQAPDLLADDAIAVEALQDHALCRGVDRRRLVAALARPDDRLAVGAQRQLLEHRRDVVTSSAAQLQPILRCGAVHAGAFALCRLRQAYASG